MRRRLLLLWCATVILVGLVAALAAPGTSRVELVTASPGSASSTQTSTGGSRDGSSSTTGSAESTSPDPTTTSTDPTRSTQIAPGASSPTSETDVGDMTPVAPPPPSTVPAPVGLPELSPPAPPDANHVVFWGRAVNDLGMPVVDACVTLSSHQPPLVTDVVVRTGTDGSYVATAGLTYPQFPMLGSMNAAPCDDHPQDLLDARAYPDMPLDPLFYGGSTNRWDFVLVRSASLVAVDLVDPAGRPISGVCGTASMRLGTSQTWQAGPTGHFDIAHPRVPEMNIYMNGVCSYFGSGASSSYRTFALHPGVNAITYVVPWSGGDSWKAPTFFPASEGQHFDLIALSTEANEPRPSCVGAFTRSRWFHMDSYWPDTMNHLGPIWGGSVASTLDVPGIVAVWGLRNGQVVEIGCAPAGAPIAIPASTYESVAIQVIPSTTVATAGSLQWLMSYG